MNSSSSQTTQQLYADIIARAAQDPAFRAALLADPAETLARVYNITLPSNVTVTVVEEQIGEHIIVLPPAPPQLEGLPLDDLELALVGGGRTLRPTPVPCTDTLRSAQTRRRTSC